MAATSFSGKLPPAWASDAVRWGNALARLIRIVAGTDENFLEEPDLSRLAKVGPFLLGRSPREIDDGVADEFGLGRDIDVAPRFISCISTSVFAIVTRRWRGWYCDDALRPRVEWWVLDEEGAYRR